MLLIFIFLKCISNNVINIFLSIILYKSNMIINILFLYIIRDKSNKINNIPLLIIIPNKSNNIININFSYNMK